MKITPRTLKGFRDFLPESMIPRERLMETARRVYRSFGYSPIDTPALEYLEILSGKGGEESDRLMYHFEDHGGRKVGMRFDLTVPLARFAAQHINELGKPFKRYHLGPVWRGENTHRGRYREFIQCDFDTIGVKSAVSDLETGLVIHDLLQAIGFERFTIRVNDRRLLNGLLENLGLREQSAALLRALDKLGKIGPEKVAQEMMTVGGATQSQAEQVLQLASLSGDDASQLKQLAKLVGDSELGQAGVAGLEAVLQGARAAGVSTNCLQIDASIARGLDYYTGVIYETFLDDLPGIGSICSGGRYDNLAELYTKQELPGVGASLGLDRLLAAMEELGMLEKVGTPADVLLVYFSDAGLSDYLRLAAALREQGVGVELYPEAKKIGQQLRYADRRGFPAAIIAGDDELARRECQLKNMSSGESSTFPLDDPAAIAEAVKKCAAP